MRRSTRANWCKRITYSYSMHVRSVCYVLNNSLYSGLRKTRCRPTCNGAFRVRDSRSSSFTVMKPVPNVREFIVSALAAKVTRRRGLDQNKYVFSARRNSPKRGRTGEVSPGGCSTNVVRRLNARSPRRVGPYRCTSRDEYR